MVGTDIERPSRSEQLLLSVAHLSPNEIAARTGFKPLEAAQRISELLDSHDYLTMKQEERLLIIQMQNLLVDARQRMERVDDDKYAAIANVVIRAAKEIGVRYDVMRKSVEVDISQITEAQAHIFGGAYDTAVDHVAKRIAENHPEIPQSEVLAYAREGVFIAKEKLKDSIGHE